MLILAVGPQPTLSVVAMEAASLWMICPAITPPAIMVTNTAMGTLQIQDPLERVSERRECADLIH